MEYPGTFESAFDEVAAELKRLMVMRQRKYGPTNISNGGGIGVALRLGDKSSRLNQAYGLPDKPHAPNEDFSDESLTDTLADAANHAIIGLLLQRGQWGLPLQETVAAAVPTPPAFANQKYRAVLPYSETPGWWVAQVGSKDHDPYLTSDVPTFTTPARCDGCSPDCAPGKCVSG